MLKQNSLCCECQNIKNFELPLAFLRHGCVNDWIWTNFDNTKYQTGMGHINTDKLLHKWLKIIEDDRRNHIQQQMTGTKYTIDSSCESTWTLNFIYALWCICHLQDGALDESLFTVSRLLWAIVSPLKTDFPQLIAVHSSQPLRLSCSSAWHRCICSTWSVPSHLGACLQ